MPNKNVNILLKLQDQFTKPMRECGVITKDQEKAMRRTSQSVIGFSRTVRNGFLGGAAHVLKFGAALTGVGGLLSAAGIKAFAADAIEGFNAAEEAETKLSAVLANVPSIIAQGAGAAEAAKERLGGVAHRVGGVPGPSLARSAREGDPRARIEGQERWYRYITEELLPAWARPGEKALACGCSMGGVHAGNFFFRRPDLFDTLISLSGLFHASYFFGDYSDELVYANSPASFLPNMPQDHPWMELYRQSQIILCCGQGAWEDDLLAGTRMLDKILTDKGIPHWADYWGTDVNHDWNWWQKQLPYFLEKTLGAA